MKVKISVVLLLMAFGSAAFGAAITKSSAAEFGASGAVFSNAEVSGDTVVLTYGPEQLWTAGGVRVNQTEGAVLDVVDMDTDGSGGAFLTWRDTRVNAGGDIYVARINSAGTVAWERVLTSTGDYRVPRVAATGKGTAYNSAIVSWQGPGTGGETDIYAAKYDINGNVEWGEEASPVKVCGAVNIQDRQRLVSDGNGGAVVVWRDKRGSNGESKEGVFAQRMDSNGNQSWTTDGVTVCASASTGLYDPKIVPVREEADDGYMIAWGDNRDGFDNLYVSRVDSSGNVDINNFTTRGTPASTSSGNKPDFKVDYGRSWNGIVLGWAEGPDGFRDSYAQRMSTVGARQWGDTGVALSTAPGDQGDAKIVTLPGYEAYFSWVDVNTFTSYFQKLNASGAPQLGADGIDLGTPLIWKMVSDGSTGVYAGAMAGASISTLMPYAQRLDSSGNELWGGEGIQLSTDYLYETELVLPVVASEDYGAIFGWVTDDEGVEDIYVQKITELYASAGTYTTEKIEATPFYSWDTIEWESSGSGAVAAEVRTAASESGLDAASWTSVANGGSIPNNGPWIQARFTFSSSADRFDTSVLDSVSFNYFATSTDTTYPVIESVMIGQALLTDPAAVYPVPADPVVDVVLTDNEEIASAAIKLDGSPVNYGRTLSSDTRWEIRGQPSVTVGDHTLGIEVTDAANNRTTATYQIRRSTETALEEGTPVGVMASGDNVYVSYSLASPVTVTVEIRDIMANLIRREVYAAGDLGGSAGYNEVVIDVGDLPRGVYILSIMPSGATPVITKFALTQ